MKNQGFSNISFQTFYMSKETTNCPYLPEITGFIKRHKKEFKDISISMRYGKRVLVNTKIIDFKEIDEKDFLELVDYDPLKKILLVIGNSTPMDYSPLHWFIHHARDDVNIACIIDFEKSFDKEKKNISTSDKDKPIWSLEKIKDVMKLLRDNKIVLIKDIGVLFVGKDFKEIEKNISKITSDLK